MLPTRRDIHGILSGLLFGERKRTSGFLAIVLVVVVALFNPASHELAAGQASRVTFQSGTTSYASGITTTAQLNLTQAYVNASRSFQESLWRSNSTTAQASINSSDSEGETVSAVWRLDQSPIAQAQIIEYDFEFATSVPIPAPSGPRITALVGLTSSSFDNWYAQSRTPIFPNNTESVSVSNVEGLYSNGSSRRSLVFEAQKVTNAQANSSGGNSTILFQREFPGYAAGDGVFHRYSIKVDLQSNRTVWIVDDTVVAAFNISFVPSNMVFVTSASDPGDSAVATLKDPVQTATIPLQTAILPPQSFTVTVSSGGQVQIGNLTALRGQVSSIQTLQNQINHLNDQVGNLTSQNAQLQAKNSQWFSQWWFSIIWGLLGAGVIGFFFVTGTRLKRKSIATSSGPDDSACPHCGGRMPPGATFCGQCGTVLRETKPVCPECGEQMPTASLYCGDCGRQMAVDDSRSRSLANTSAPESPDEKEEGWR